MSQTLLLRGDVNLRNFADPGRDGLEQAMHIHRLGEANSV